MKYDIEVKSSCIHIFEMYSILCAKYVARIQEILSKTLYMSATAKHFVLMEALCMNFIFLFIKSICLTLEDKRAEKQGEYQFL